MCLSSEVSTTAPAPMGTRYPDDVLATILAQRCARRLSPPQHIEAFHDLRRDKIAAVHTLVSSQNPDTEQFFINGQQFDSNRVDVGRGSARRRNGRSSTPLTSSTHSTCTPTLSRWFQSVGSPTKPTATRIPWSSLFTGRSGFGPISDFTGTTIFHCHIMHHEENGMMGVLRIV